VRPVTVETLRLFLHILAATIWVGGQITLAALIPALRAAGTDVPKAAANAFNRVAWPAFGILVLTGIWNVEAEGDKGVAYQHTLLLKYTLVVSSGFTAYMHARVASRKAMAVFGAHRAGHAVCRDHARRMIRPTARMWARASLHAVHPPTPAAYRSGLTRSRTESTTWRLNSSRLLATDSNPSSHPDSEPARMLATG
jgi:putative copper export protein